MNKTIADKIKRARLKRVYHTENSANFFCCFDGGIKLALNILIKGEKYEKKTSGQNV